MGFSFNGKHSKTIKGLSVRTIKNEILPERKEIIIDSNFIDGEYDFTNWSGRAKYKNRTFEFEFFLIGENVFDLNDTIKEVVSWLNVGFSNLILDDCNNLVWRAKLANKMDIEKQLRRCGNVSIFFTIEPFGRGTTVQNSVSDGINEIYCDGFFANPILTLETTGSYISVGVNNTGLRCIGNNIIINCEKQMAQGADRLEKDSVFQKFGFFELKKGTNDLLIDSDGAVSGTIEFIPLYIWR